jgi:hypothetical protein
LLFKEASITLSPRSLVLWNGDMSGAAPLYPLSISPSGSWLPVWNWLVIFLNSILKVYKSDLRFKVPTT